LNEAASIQAAVSAALRAGVHEIIVVDGGSCDQTMELARSAGAVVDTAPRGRATQQNRGAQKAVGDILWFVHADCRPDADCVRQVREALTDERVMAGAFRQRIDARGWLYRWLERGNAFRASRLGMPYGDQGLFFRRSLFESLGGFPEVPILEDYLLMRQARRLTAPILLTGPLHVSARRWQQRGAICQTLRNWSMVAATEMGIAPARLARFYPVHKDGAAEGPDALDPPAGDPP